MSGLFPFSVARLVLVAVAGLALAVAVPSSANAQAEGEVWLRAGARVEPASKLQLDYFQDLRFGRVFSETGRWMHTGAVGFRPVKWLSAEAGYRFDPRFEKKSGCCSHRGFGALEWTPRFGRLRFGVRQRWQSTFKPDSQKHTWRSRAQLAYRATKLLRPYLAAESFVRLADDEAGYEKTRLTAGLALAWSAFKLKPFYRVEISAIDEPLTHIAGLFARYTFK